MSGSSTKSKKPFVDHLDPFERGLEAMRSLGQHAGKGTQREAGEVTKTALAQMFGFEKNTDETTTEKAPQAQSHEPAQANGRIEVFNAKLHNTAPSKKSPIHAEKTPAKAEAAIDYHGQFRNEIIHSRERASKGEMNQMRQNIEEI